MINHKWTNKICSWWCSRDRLMERNLAAIKFSLLRKCRTNSMMLLKEKGSRNIQSSWSNSFKSSKVMWIRRPPCFRLFLIRCILTWTVSKLRSSDKQMLNLSNWRSCLITRRLRKFSLRVRTFWDKVWMGNKSRLKLTLVDTLVFHVFLMRLKVSKINISRGWQKLLQVVSIKWLIQWQTNFTNCIFQFKK